MSIKVFAYFDKKNLPKLLLALQGLNSYTAQTIGETEKPSKLDIKITDKEQVHSFLTGHSEGFFMHTNMGLYNVSLQDKTYSTVCFYPNESLKEDCILEILTAYVFADAEFGYAADEEEYEYRNRIKLDVSGSEVESWVGRNLSKYISGLYYFTLISNNQAELKSIEVNILKANAVDFFEVSGKSVIYKFYESPDLWKSQKAKIDQLCRLNKNIFSKDEIEDVALKSTTVMDFIMKTREWN